VRDLLQLDNVRREVGLRFRRFLMSYKDARGSVIYVDRINRLAEGIAFQMPSLL
jgi:hypothetical protein